jgi:periplasmic divalent cation tolerance protein
MRADGGLRPGHDGNGDAGGCGGPGSLGTTGKLAASAQVAGPVLSMAWHLGDLVEAEEWQLILKTPTDRVEDLVRHLVDTHPWKNPEVSVTPFEAGTDAYRVWLDQVTSADEG